MLRICLMSGFEGQKNGCLEKLRKKAEFLFFVVKSGWRINMPPTPEITTSQAAMIRAHVLKDEFKTEVMEMKGDESPSVVWSTHEAALAFGISQTVFQALDERGGVFVIQVIDNNVVMSLERGVVDYRRNLWDEMIDRFSRGRSQAGVTKDAYDALFDITQLCHQGKVAEALEKPIPEELSEVKAFAQLRDDLEMTDDAQPDDLTLLQGLVYVYFFRLTGGIRETFVQDGKVPWLVFQEGE